MTVPVEENLTEEEFDALVTLKEEHRPFFDAMMYTLGVIVDRNHKYTGHESDRNVFENFINDAELQNVRVEDSFKQWISKKVTRVMLNDGNYSDESFTDSLRDLANYAILWIAWLQYQEPVFEEHDSTRASEPDMDIKGMDNKTFKQPYVAGQNGILVGRVRDVRDITNK